MKLYHREFSSGSEKERVLAPVIMMHGMGFSGKNFTKVAPMIAKMTKRKVYVPDARDHGRSPWTHEINYDVLTSDLLEFMEQQRIQKAVLIGNSMGGRTAMNFALKYPDKVDALIIEDMTPRNVKSRGKNLVQMILQYVADFFQSIPPETKLDEVKVLVATRIIELLSPAYVDKERMLKNVDFDVVPIVEDGTSFKVECNLDALLATMIDTDGLVQNLPEQDLTFTGNALFIYGSKGFFNLGKDPSVKKLFPRAIIKKIDGACHFIHIDSPDLYAQVVSEFILLKSLPMSKY